MTPVCKFANAIFCTYDKDLDTLVNRLEHDTALVVV